MAGEVDIVDAAHAGDAAQVRLLIEGGADVNAAEPCGRTALMAAAAGKHAEIVVLLIDNMADICREDGKGLDAKVYAAEAGHPSMVSLISRAVAERDARIAEEKRRCEIAAVVDGLANGTCGMLKVGHSLKIAKGGPRG